MVQMLSMPALFEKLLKLGLREDDVRRLGLPSWWNDELNNKPAAVLEGAGHIAKRLHLDLSSLLKEAQEAQFKPLPQTKFKYHLQQGSDVPSTSHQLASRVAELVALGVQKPFVPIPSDVNQIRVEILQDSPQVNLESILSYCWKHGIAVVYFNDYPAKTRKITGLIQWRGDRPVIVLSSQRTQPSWLTFHLAHELGHLALGHVKEGILIDDEIDNKSDDQEEIDSNQFAVKLMINDLDNCLANEKFNSAAHLKSKINKLLKSDQTVDPCAIAWNYAWHTGSNYGFSQQAIRILNPSNDGHTIINQFLGSHVDWESLSDDNADHLERILGD